jgi:hypothetical protein
VPFDFLRKKKAPEPEKPPEAPPRRTPTGTPVPFDGVTDEWRLVGQMYLDTRLSDALNRREALDITNVSWAPIDGSSSFSPVPGLKSVDPYDFIVVLADESSKGVLSEEERAAYLAQKIAHEVALDAPPLRITGTVHLAPGVAPEALLERSTEMFVPVVGGVAYVGDREVSDPKVDAILVNRFYLRGVKRTGSAASSASEASSAPASSSAAPSASASGSGPGSSSGSPASANPSAGDPPAGNPSSAASSASSSPATTKQPSKPAPSQPRGRPKRGGLGPRT